MSDEFEKLLRSKEWNELTYDEKELAMRHVATEGDYFSLRKVSLALDKKPIASIEPGKEILHSLKTKMSGRTKEARPSWAAIVFRHKTPAYGTALWVGIALFVGWSLGKEKQIGSTMSERIVYQTDTVYQSLPSDTVYVKQVVYKYLPAKKAEPLITKVTTPEASLKGINMKEKEELETLLVSGSE